MKKYYIYLPNDLTEYHKRGYDKTIHIPYEIGKKCDAYEYKDVGCYARTDYWWYVVYTHPIIAQIICISPKEKLFEVYIDDEKSLNDYTKKARYITLIREITPTELTLEQYAMLAINWARIYFDNDVPRFRGFEKRYLAKHKDWDQPEDIDVWKIWKYWATTFTSNFSKLVSAASVVHNHYFQLTYGQCDPASAHLAARTTQLVAIREEKSASRKIIMNMIIRHLADCMDQKGTPLTSKELITVIENVLDNK